MLLRSQQTDDPLTAWTQVHSHILSGEIRDRRLSSDFIHAKLALFCRGMQVQKKTLFWAIENGLLQAHPEDMPTSYSLTEKGRAWTANI
jgi:hypothetical protein